MRLVCPNCEAKYEVPDDAIPDTGRDVQCTNCGHTWFQMRGRTGTFVPPAPAEPAAAADAVEEPASTPEPAPSVEALAEARVDVGEPPVDAFPREEPSVTAAKKELVSGEAGIATDDRDAEPLPDAPQPVAEGPAGADAAATDTPLAADVERAEDLAEAPPAQEPDPIVEPVADVVAGSSDTVERPAVVAEAAEETSAAPVATYAVDESVLAILREEAEREANARRADALESQTDLGIDSAMPRKGGAVVVADTKPSARRDLLPDVEEINSTLRPSEMQAEADGTPDFVAPPPVAPRGFRSGFLSLMTIAILGAALYLAAPRLAVAVPALAGPLEAYVSLIDSMRLGLDGMMRSATVAISDG